MLTRPLRRKRQKLSDVIVESVKRSIVTDALKPGDRLPTERELMESFQCSKGSAREALKALEVEGLGYRDIAIPDSAFERDILEHLAADPRIRKDYAVLARAHARRGDEPGCTAALLQADMALERSAPADEPEIDRHVAGWLSARSILSRA